MQATTHYLDADFLALVSEKLGVPMVIMDVTTQESSELLQTRGW